MADPQSAHYDPWRNLHRLPETAPIHALRPDDYPQPLVAADRLRQEGIDPTSAGVIITAIIRRGWTFRLTGGMFGLEQPSFTAAIIEPRFMVPWAQSPAQPTPAAALAVVLVVCLDNPPWERDDNSGAEKAGQS